MATGDGRAGGAFALGMSSSRVVGYARVSTTAQGLAAQEDALRAAGAEYIYADHGVSGARAGRP